MTVAAPNGATLDSPPRVGTLSGAMRAAALTIFAVYSAAAACSQGPFSGPDAYVALDAPAHVGAGSGGGQLDNLVFAVVGDSRPANPDDTANYPTAVVKQIFTDVAGDPAQPRFALTTGDYMDCTTTGDQVDPQLDQYLGARATFPGVVYPAMGNHECNSLVQSNCGPNGADGEPPNYTQFIARLTMDVGEPHAYYTERFAATDGSWTAKLLFVAVNAWDDDQAKWFAGAMANESTTYTFVIRHEPADAYHAPGVPPTTDVLLVNKPTLLITGHTHTYQHVPSINEIVVGNGGAPLTSSIDYGYVIIARQSDGTLRVTAKDYMTLATIDDFAVDAAGDVVALPAPP